MRIDRLTVKNFRNLADLDLRLQPRTVVVGENRSGKSNLIHALRLVLDPRLSQADRKLTREDFWDGLSDGSPDWDPMSAGEIIEITVEISEFEGETASLVVLSDALIEGTPVRARLTYRFGPRIGSDGNPEGYAPSIYGGANPENFVPIETRSYLHLVFLHALRDAESDIAGWRKSPLRELLESTASQITKEDLKRIAETVKAANDEVGALEEVRALGARISERTHEMVGSTQALDAELGVTPLDPLRLVRGMKLFVDGDARRPLGSASLGTLNVLYLALLELGLDARLDASGLAHVVYAIEEPEAHLHPHLQRVVYKRILSTGEGQFSTIVTTQSPHIASVTPPQNLVVLRSDTNQTIACAAADADLTQSEWRDVERYLDATRAELVFARKVLLVEGFGEQVLVPSFARKLGLDLDKEGITVCAIHGTHFSTYVRFCEALGIPWAVLTDGDINSRGESEGQKRAKRLLEYLSRSGESAESGIFIGTTTLEHDIYKASDQNAETIAAVLADLSSDRSKPTIQEWSTTPPSVEELVSSVYRAGGKGRVSQRLAPMDLDPPTYIEDALRYLATR